MQIHEITLKNKTVTEGVLGAIADIAGRSIMQKYGGKDGQFAGPQVSASGAQAAATQANAPLIDKLSKSLMQTYKRDVGALIKSSRDPNTQAQATNATNLADQSLMLPLQQSIAKSLKFDYTQLPAKVDPAAFNGRGKDTAMAIKNQISDLIMKIAAYEKNPTPESAKEQMRLFTVLAQEVASAQSMSTFQTGSSVSTPRYELLLAKAKAGTLTPDEQKILNAGIKSGQLNIS